MWTGPSDTTGSGYDIGGSRGNGKRRTAMIETKSEDEILAASQRLKVLNLTREGMRNAPQVRALVQQLRVLTVGLLGGKLTMSTEDNKWNAEAQDFFGDSARSIDFIDGTDLNNSLKLILTSLAAEGGDYAIVFDDGVLSGDYGTGKFRFFESDNIANIDPVEFKNRFGEKWAQSQGLIYNELGRFVGIILSGKKRGKQIFAKDECFTLVRDPDADASEACWFYGKRKWRLLQGRGISPQTVAIAALLDMYELVSSEVQSGKLNSKIFAQVVDSMGVEDGSDGSEEIDSGVADEATTVAPEEDGEEDGTEVVEEVTTDDQLDVTEFEGTTGGKVLNPPTGTKLELLDMKRPSENAIKFVDWLNGGAAAVHGLARVYAGLKAESSYTAFRGEQCISLPSIEEGQKELERGPLDWIGIKRIQWGISVGLLRDGPAGWQKKMQWSWPSMKEVNEVDAQAAVTAKIKNYMTTYQQLLGPNWKTILVQVSNEMKWFADNNLTHPANVTVSGQVVQATDTSDPAKRGKDEEK